MKILLLVGAIALGLVAVEAGATCPGTTRVTKVNGTGGLVTLLTGNTVCVGAPGAWKWQELHASGGTLTDFKLGNTVEPSEVVGTWSVGTGSGTGNPAVVIYCYGSGCTGGTYTYAVYGSGVVGTSHTFCPSPTGTEATGIVKLGGGSC